jgi:hypothetical protein
VKKEKGHCGVEIDESLDTFRRRSITDEIAQWMDKCKIK